MRANLLNFVAFQVCWFCNVVGAAAGLPWLGPLVTAVWIAAHLLASSEGRHSEWRVLLAAAVIGYCVDSAMTLGGLIAFPSIAQLGSPSPIWMVALWVGFAATLSHSLGWLGGRYALAALLGAVGGPLAYYSGQHLGAITLASGAESLASIGIAWAIAVPMLVAINDLLAGRPEVDSPAALARRDIQ